MNNKTVYIEPWSSNLLQNRLFDSDDTSRKDYLLPYAYLKKYCEEKGIILETSDKIPKAEDTDNKYLYYSFGSLKGLSILKDRHDITFGSIYLFEPPIKVLTKKRDIYHQLPFLSNLFKRIYTTSPISEINKIYKSNYELDTVIFQYPQSHSEILEKYWGRTNRQLLVMINSYRYSRLKKNEFYSERLKILNYFFKKDSFDLYGRDWNKLSGNLVRNFIESLLWSLKWFNNRRIKDFFVSIPIRSKLKKVTPSIDKYETLSKYKFAICFESMGIEGFISEKIFECFFCGTIPIYLGDPKITDKIPEDTFIDFRNFRNYDHLFNYINNMNEDKYNTYINNIRNFIASNSYYPFTKEYFADKFYKDVISDME